MGAGIINYISSLGAVKLVSGLLTITIAAIVVTPLCGFLFDCGCTWPWAGLEENCNIHDRHAPHHCPWCASAFAGGLSVFLSISTDVLSAVYLTHGDSGDRLSLLTEIKSASKIIQGTSSGMLAFLASAAITGWIAAKTQGYPTFLVY